jgi:peptidoglycan pentaglycine glycine transferase (the first glycine)
MKACIISDRRQWNEFVATSVCCNITQSYEWGQLAPHLGAEALYAGVVDDAGRLCAVMLVLIARLPLLGQTYFYAPRGPVIEDPFSPALALLLDFVRAEARTRGAFMLKVEPSVPDGDERWLTALRQHGFRRTPYASHIRHEWVLDIRPDEQTLLANMKEKWRYNIRLATRKGVSVRRGEGAADLDTFYRLYQVTSERDHFFIHAKAHYEDVLRLYGEDERAALFLAEYEGQAIAAIIVLRFGRWSWYMYGASSNEHRNRMPNHLLQWTAIRWAKEHGCWYYNFRGIPDVLEEDQELWGVYVFKQGFGGYPLRFLETHDLVYRPAIYALYRRLLDLKRRRDEWQRRRLSADRRGAVRQGSEA